MRSDIIRMYKDVHSWVGIISGLFLFIAFYAGAITMFEVPLQRWASPPSPAMPGYSQAVALEDTDKLVAAVIAEHPDAAKRYTIHVNVTPETPARMSWTTGQRGEPGPTYYASFDKTGEVAVTEQGPSPVAEFVDILHQQIGLPLPHEPAMMLMGAVCLLYAIALVSGTFVLIPSLIKDLFLVRLGKNVKRMWLDVHNVLGLFSLPFHIVIVLTSLVFAFHDQFYEVQETVFARSIVAEEHHDKPKANGPLMAPHLLVKEVNRQLPSFTPETLLYAQDKKTKAYGLRVQGVDPMRGLRGPTFGVGIVDPYSGAIVGDDYLPGKQSGWFATVSSFFSLHFGNFGGAPVRWMYFALGLAGAFLFYTGNLLWVESRRKKERKAGAVEQTRSTRALASLTIGVTTGSMAGISLTIAAAKWLGGGATEGQHSLIYYALFLGMTAWAFVRGAAKSAPELLILTALATLAIPVTSLLGEIMGAWNYGGATLLVDGVALLGAAFFLYAAKRARTRALHGPRDSVWSVKDGQAPALPQEPVTV